MSRRLWRVCACDRRALVRSRLAAWARSEHGPLALLCPTSDAARAPARVASAPSPLRASGRCPANACASCATLVDSCVPPWAVATRQMRKCGNLWRFSTRAVEGRGGRLKHIGRRMVCWRLRSNGKYKRIVRGRVVEQTYSSAPERQLMRTACSREERAHTQQRSRVATTGRNTLKREGALATRAARARARQGARGIARQPRQGEGTVLRSGPRRRIHARERAPVACTHPPQAARHAPCAHLQPLTESIATSPCASPRAPEAATCGTAVGRARDQPSPPGLARQGRARRPHT